MDFSVCGTWRRSGGNMIAWGQTAEAWDMCDEFRWPRYPESHGYLIIPAVQSAPATPKEPQLSSPETTS